MVHRADITYGLFLLSPILSSIKQLDERQSVNIYLLILVILLKLLYLKTFLTGHFETLFYE